MTSKRKLRLNVVLDCFEACYIVGGERGAYWVWVIFGGGIRDQLPRVEIYPDMKQEVPEALWAKNLNSSTLSRAWAERTAEKAVLQYEKEQRQIEEWERRHK